MEKVSSSREEIGSSIEVSIMRYFRLNWFVLFLFGVLGATTKAAPFMIEQRVDLSPLANNSGWSVTLPPYYTAKVTVKISTAGKGANGIIYILDSKSIVAVLSDPSAAINWTISPPPPFTDTVTAFITNPSTATRTVSFSVTCRWDPLPGGGPGAGKGNPPQPITGLANVTATLLGTYVVWQFTPAAQIADGFNFLTYSAAVYTSAGTKLTSKLVPGTVTAVDVDVANAGWEVFDAKNENGEASGKLRSSGKRMSHGKLQLDYGTTAKSPEITFFWLTVDVANLGVGAVDWKPNVPSLYLSLTQVSQSIIVNPPGIVDLSPYRITETILNPFFVLDDRDDPLKEEILQGNKNMFDGAAPANGVLLDQATAKPPHGPDLKYSPGPFPYEPRFKYSYSQQRTSLDGSPYRIPAKVWGWGFYRYKNPDVNYGVQIFYPTEAP